MAITLTYPKNASVRHGDGWAVVTLTDADGFKLDIQTTPERAALLAAVFHLRGEPHHAVIAAAVDRRTAPEGVPMSDLWPLTPGTVVEVVASGNLPGGYPVGAKIIADADGCIRGVANHSLTWLTRADDYYDGDSPLFRIIGLPVSP